MNAVSPVRALVAYYWNTWYFLAAVFGAVSSLLLGAWISSAANGTPITGGYCVYFTATQPLICLSLLFACDARVAKAHYGGLPRHVYSAWTPCSLRAVFRALILTSVNLIGVLCFDAIMVLTGTGIHPHLAAVLCFVVLQSLATSLIYSIVEIAATLSRRPPPIPEPPESSRPSFAMHGFSCRATFPTMRRPTSRTPYGPSDLT